MKSANQTQIIKIVFAAFVLWRSLLFIVAYYGQNFLNFLPSFPYSDAYLIPSGLPQWLWAWGNFDGVHYLTIARFGYIAQFTQAFFPLYPILINFLGSIVSDKYMIVTGLLISNITFLIALGLLIKLLSLDYNKYFIMWTVIFLLAFPTSFYFGAIYTESIFFLFTIATFWFARKKSWYIASMFAALASLTRVIGIFLLPVLLWEWYKYGNDKNPKIKSISSHRFLDKVNQLKQIATDIFCSPVLYISPLGLISYMIYLQVKFGDWLYFWHAQSAFGAERSGVSAIFPLQTIWRYIKILFSVSYTSPAYTSALMEVGAFIYIILMLFQAHRHKIRTSYLIFSWLAVLLPGSTGTFSSVPRYILLIFPQFIVLAQINNLKIRLLILSIFFIVLTLLTLRFIQGFWVA